VAGESQVVTRARSRRYLAVFALFCFGFFGVLAFLSISNLFRGPKGPSRCDASMLPGAAARRHPGDRLGPRGQPVRAPAMAGMTSWPMRSSCSRSSPFMR
jgi:hypothetical protein